MKTLATIIDRILKNIFKRHGPIFSEIMVNWSKIVGAKYYLICKPVRISYHNEKNVRVSVLYIEVDNAGSSVELSYQYGIILERIAVYFGYKAIDRIKFFVSPKVSLEGK